MGQITEVQIEKSRVRIIFDGEETYHLSRRAYAESGLAQGDELTSGELKKQILLLQYPEASNRAVGFLALRARSEREIERKLISCGYLDDTVDMVLCKLQKEGFVDDEAFARDWVSDRLHRQLGKTRIYRELLQKGVDSEIAEAACQAIDEDEHGQQACQLAQKLLKRHLSEPEKKAVDKTIQALIRRGYAYSDAKEALRSALEALHQEQCD